MRSLWEPLDIAPARLVQKQGEDTFFMLGRQSDSEPHPPWIVLNLKTGFAPFTTGSKEKLADWLTENRMEPVAVGTNTNRVLAAAALEDLF